MQSRGNISLRDENDFHDVRHLLSELPYKIKEEVQNQTQSRQFNGRDKSDISERVVRGTATEWAGLVI